MFTYGVPSLRPKRNPTPVSNVCEAEPIRTHELYRKYVSHFPDRQIEHGISNRPVMARTQMLVFG